MISLFSRILFLGCLIAELSGCAPEEPLYDRPILLENFKKDPVHGKLISLSAISVKLTCDPAIHQVVGTFSFEYLESRPDVTVAGDTPCTNEGRLLTWEHSYPLFGIGQPQEILVTRENYRLEIISNMIDMLLNKSDVKPNGWNKDNSVVSNILKQKYANFISSKGVYAVLFRCDHPGAQYSYYSRVEHTKDAGRGVLSTRCSNTQQNFEVRIPFDGAEFQVHQYGEIRDDVMVTVFSDFIEDGPSVSKF